jgi:hypothetical protein
MKFQISDKHGVMQNDISPGFAKIKKQDKYAHPAFVIGNEINVSY